MRRYEIHAAHRLTAGVPEGHRCRREHGHRYNIEIEVRLVGALENGMVIEYGELDLVTGELLGIVDHWSLNTLDDRAMTAMEQARAVAENPTVELFAIWLLKAMQFRLPSRVKVCRVSIEEEANASATVTE